MMKDTIITIGKHKYIKVTYKAKTGFLPAIVGGSTEYYCHHMECSAIVCSQCALERGQAYDIFAGKTRYQCTSQGSVQNYLDKLATIELLRGRK